jgi:hypothetical protein
MLKFTQIQSHTLPPVPLDTADAELSVAHLQLSRTTEKYLLNLRIRTIGKLSEEVADGALDKWKLGDPPTADIERAIKSLLSHTDQQGRIDWPKYWASLPTLPQSLALTSVQLESLSPEIRNLPVTTLNFAKAGKPLRDAGISTLGDLLDRLREGLGKIRNFGALAHREVVEATVALSESARGNGHVDWLYYTERRGLTVFPKSASGLNSQSFVTELPVLARQVVELQLGEREVTILNRRLLANPKQRRTLEQIGEVTGLTRERVRQLERRTLDVLRNPLIHDDYDGMKFRFRPDFAGPLREASEHFGKFGIPAWRRDRWVSELASLWGAGKIEIAKNYFLLCKLLAYDEVRPAHTQLETLVYQIATPPKIVDRTVAAVDAIHEALLDSLEGCDDFDLVIQTNRHLPARHKISIEELPELIDLVSSVEVIGGGLYRLKIAQLRNRADQAVRILSDAGSPMGKAHLAREINRTHVGQKPVKTNNLVNQMIGDQRLEPIGKSGLWALKSWGPETRTIIEIIEECLHSSGEAMTVDEIYEEVSRLRPVAPASVPLTLMDHTDRFTRVTRDTWGLVAWGDNLAGQWWDNDEIGKHVDRFFARKGTDRVAFAELRRAIETALGLSAPSARGVLARHPSILVERPDQRQRIAVLRSGWRKLPPTSRTNKRRKPLVRDLIAQAIRGRLEAESTHEVPLIDLVKQVEKELKVPRPSVYAVVQQSDEFEAVAVGDLSYKICRFTGQTRPEFPQLEHIKPANWKTELQRAIEKINIEDVDIGLFLTGRQFESSMKALLGAADRRGDPPVAEGNKAKLNNMIDWAISRGLFVDQGTLHLLRIERNERAHKPPLSERSALLKAAPFLVALYLDYILMVQDRLINWGLLGEVDGKS